MSKLSIPQDQIDTMTLEVVSDVLSKMQQEMVDLAGLEYRLYKQRRKLELKLHPELEQEQEDSVVQPKKMSIEELKKLVQIAHERGVDLSEYI